VPSASGLIAAQVGVYIFGGDWTLSPPAAGGSAVIDRAAAIALASPPAELASVDVATATPLVSYGTLLDRSRTKKLVVDVRFLDVVGLGPGGEPASSVSEPAEPAPTPRPLDINVILDPVTGAYLEEVDEPAASPTPADAITPQVGDYSFGGGQGALLPPVAADPAPVIDRARAINGASRGGTWLAATFAQNTPSVVYGRYTGPQAHGELVVDVRFLDVYDEVGPLGAGVSSGSPAPQLAPHGHVDINILLDARTGAYLTESDDGRA
jgi:hypothetical protein